MSLYGGIKVVGKPDLDQVRKLDLMTVQPTIRMQKYGMAIDRAHFGELSRKLDGQIKQLRSEICAFIPPEKLDEFLEKIDKDGDEEFNVNSRDQLSILLFDVLRVGEHRSLKTTKNGNRISTNKKQLEQLKREHPIVQKTLDYAEAAKLKSTYTDALPRLAVEHRAGTCWCGLKHFGKTWRVHSQILWTRTDTGRPASKAPNLYNIPARKPIGREIRAGFIASPGTRMVASDFAQEEMRLGAHYSQDKNLIRIFELGLDPHTETAKRAFKTENPDKLSQRDPCKNVNFGVCIAEGQLVLTDHGLIPIQEIKCCHKVWDGIEFVEHEGVVCRGYKEVIEYDGLSATPDHKVWVEGKARPISLSEAMAEGRRLVTSSIMDSPIRVSDYYVKENSPSEWLQESVYQMHSLRGSVGPFSRQHPIWEDERLPLQERIEVSRPTGESFVREIFSNHSAMRESKLRQLAELWRPWYQERIQDYSGVHKPRSCGTSTSDVQGSGHWEDRQQWKLPTREFGLRDAKQEPQQHQKKCDRQLQGKEHDGHGDGKEDVSGLSMVQVGENQSGQIGLRRVGVEGNSKPEAERPVQKVYDIMNAGPRRRFTVSGKLVSNCYGLSGPGLYDLMAITYAAANAPLPTWMDIEWCEQFIKDWYELYPGMKDYLAEQHYRAQRYGIVWSLFGRIRRVPEIHSYHSRIRNAGLRQAGNMPIQSSGADLLHLVLGEMEEKTQEMERLGIWMWPLNCPYDEVLMEVEEDYAGYVEKVLKEVMEGVMTDKETGKNGLRVPVKVESKIEERWMK